jgi:hypothetical protein
MIREEEEDVCLLALSMIKVLHEGSSTFFFSLLASRFASKQSLVYTVIYLTISLSLVACRFYPSI